MILPRFEVFGNKGCGLSVLFPPLVGRRDKNIIALNISPWLKRSNIVKDRMVMSSIPSDNILGD